MVHRVLGMKIIKRVNLDKREKEQGLSPRTLQWKKLGNLRETRKKNVGVACESGEY